MTEKIIQYEEQPHEVSVLVLNELTAKGDLKPHIQVEIRRKLNDQELADNLDVILEENLKLAASKTTAYLNRLLEDGEKDEADL